MLRLLARRSRRLRSILTFSPLLAAALMLLASGCSATPPGVLARKTDSRAEARLLPAGPTGAMSEIGLTESNVAGARKLVASRGFVIRTEAADDSRNWELQLSDYPANTARCHLVLKEQSGRMYIVTADYSASSGESREEWSLAPDANADGSSCTIHTDEDGRTHLAFSISVVSEAWPKRSTLKGVVVATK